MEAQTRRRLLRQIQPQRQILQRSKKSFEKTILCGEKVTAITENAAEFFVVRKGDILRKYKRRFMLKMRLFER